MANNSNNNIANALRPGTVLAGAMRTYTVESVLGAGGFGITYLVTVRDAAGNIVSHMALKEHFMADYNERDAATQQVSTPGSARIRQTAENSLKDFLAEARRLRQVGSRHPNIVKVDDVFEANGTAYYAMEYLQGVSLWDYIANRPLGEGAMLGAMMPIVDAVDFLHRERLTHLDIKPQNIMIVGEGADARPVLIDFGLSKHYDEHGNATSTVNTMACSDGYSPIEQYSGISTFSPAADVYALGATMLACLTGKTPAKSTAWGAGEPQRTIMLLQASQPTCAAIACALSPMAAYRYPDAGAFEAALGGKPMTVAPPLPPAAPSVATRVLDPAVGVPVKKKRTGAIVAAVAAAIAVIAFIAGVLSFVFTPAPPDPAEPWVPDTLTVEVIDEPDEQKLAELEPIEEEVVQQQITEIAIVPDEPVEEVQPNHQPNVGEVPYDPAEAAATEDLRQNIVTQPEPEPVSERVYSIAMVEQRPVFTGGESAMYTYLYNNINYPPTAAEEGVQGRVVVSFTVERDGSISDVRVVRPRHPALDAEALRVVRAMPRWQPGRNNGQPVRVTYTLPVTFRLQG